MKIINYKWCLCVILLFCIFYLGIHILTTKQHFVSKNCDDYFLKAENYKTKLTKFKLNTNLNTKLNDKFFFLLEINTISHKCSGQKLIIDDISKLDIDTLKTYINGLSVDCFAIILNCYKHKLLKDIKSLVIAKLKPYIYEINDGDTKNVKYYIDTLKNQININKKIKKKILIDSNTDSNELLNNYSDNLMNILLNLSTDITSIEDDTKLKASLDSFLKIYKYIYNIFITTDKKKFIEMVYINENTTTQKPLTNDEITQKYIDEQANNSLENDNNNIFDSNYLIKLENNILDLFCYDLYNIINKIDTNNNKIQFIDHDSLLKQFKKLETIFSEQSKSNDIRTHFSNVGNDLLNKIKKYNTHFN